MLELMSIGIATNQKRAAKWTLKQERELIKYAGKLTVVELEDKIGQTSGSIYRKAAELNISVNSKITKSH